MEKVINLSKVKPSVSVVKYLRLSKRENKRVFNSKTMCFEYKKV